MSFIVMPSSVKFCNLAVTGSQPGELFRTVDDFALVDVSTMCLCPTTKVTYLNKKGTY